MFHRIDPLSGFIEDKRGKISYLVVADNLKELKVWNNNLHDCNFTYTHAEYHDFMIVHFLKVNPLGVRLAKLFCSHHNGFMNFDDFLNMVAVMGNKCEPEVKLQWAFLLYGTHKHIYIHTHSRKMLCIYMMSSSLIDIHVT